MANKYPKVNHIDNLYKVNIDRDNDIFTVEEKIDGSNVTISVYENEEIKLFSRTTEINRLEPGNWTPFIEYVDKNKHTFLEEAKKITKNIFEPPINFHGEWLMQAKIAYNNTKQHTFWLFDITIGERNEETETLSWLDNEEFAIAKNNLSKSGTINIVPVISNNITMNEFLNSKNSFIESQPSLVDNRFKREGVVLKTVDRQLRIKFVSEEFRETMGSGMKVSTKGEENPIVEKITMLLKGENVIHHNRIQKFVHRLKELGTIESYVDFSDGKIIGKLIKNIDLLIDDFKTEELKNLQKTIDTLINKQCIKEVKNYIEKQKIFSQSSIEDEKIQKEIK